jgi:hypothetical protein
VTRSTIILLGVLVAVAVNVGAFGASGNAPKKSLQQAAMDGDVEALNFYAAQNDADFKAEDPQGYTPLQRVVEMRRTEAAKVIIESGKADVNKANRNGKTPLMIAAGNGDKEIVEALLAGDADVRAKDSGDWTALHWAMQSGDKDIVQGLVKQGADVNAISRNGQTPYTMAQQMGRPELAEFLRASGGKDLQSLQAGPYGPGDSAGGQMPMGPGGAAARRTITIDPNEVMKKLLAFQDLGPGLKTVEDKSAGEHNGWVQRRYDNRMALLTAGEQQFATEMAFVKPIAAAEKAVKTSKAIDELTAQRKKRTDQINEQLREQRRATMMQNRQTGMVGTGPAGARPVRGMRGQAPGNTGAPGGAAYAGPSPYAGTSPAGSAALKAPANEPPPDPNTQALIQAWLGARPEDKRALLQAVEEQNLLDLQQLDDLAVREKALKTSAAIECLMMLREQRVAKITTAWQEEEARMQRLQGMPGRGGMPGNQPGQPGQMPMRGRRTR